MVFSFTLGLVSDSQTNTIMYKLFYFISLLVFLPVFIFAQNSDLQQARREFRNNNFYWATYYSACALNRSNLTTSQLKSAQKILRESYDSGIARVEEFIEKDRLAYQTFVDDETVEGRRRIIGDLENLAKLNDTILAIPQQNLVSAKKKEPDLSFKKLNYSERIERAKTAFEESVQLAANLHYNNALTLDTAISISNLVKAYDEYTACMGYVPDYKDAKSRQIGVGDKIGSLDYTLGEAEFAKAEMENIERALSYFNHGLHYSQNPKLFEGKEGAVLVLSEMYYAEAEAYLRGREVVVNQTNTATNHSSESRGLTMGISENSVIGQVVSELTGRPSASESSSTNEVVTTTTTTHFEPPSLDNHFEALIWLRKLQKINPGFKDAVQLTRKAESGLQFTDTRNNQTYSTFLVGDIIWMQTDLNFEVAGSQYYYWTDKYGKTTTMYELGRFYPGTVVNQYKNSLCPAGWRLPSVQDAKNLMKDRTQKDLIVGNLSFGKLGYGFRASGQAYVGQAFSLQGSGNTGEWWLGEPGKTLMFTTDFRQGTSEQEMYHHCRCVKDHIPNR